MAASDLPPFDIQRYWEDRLREHPDITGVGGAGLPTRFGALMYKARMAQMDRALRRVGMASLKGSTVLDVGSGTGIWLNFWRERGAHLAGLDFAEPGVDVLRRSFPDALIAQADITSERLPLPAEMRFELISACEVFLHVLDETGFDRALGNLAAHCASGGLLLISDPVVSGSGYTPARTAARYLTVRSAAEYRHALERHGFTIEMIRPATILLNSPLEAPTETLFRLMRLWWRLCVRSARWWARSAALTTVIGYALLLVDRFACRVWTRGATPTSKLIIARRS